MQQRDKGVDQAAKFPRSQPDGRWDVLGQVRSMEAPHPEKYRTQKNHYKRPGARY